VDQEVTARLVARAVARWDDPLTVLCLYLIGDGLRDALDPRLKTH
jgi:hypothetical protein